MTGAGGYVAGFVIAELESAHELTLFSRRSLESDHRVVTGDFRAEQDCLRAVEGADVVVHLGAVPEPSPETFPVNALSTYRILDAARQQGVRRVVMASSNCVYGHCYRHSATVFQARYLPIDEAHPCRPEDNYGLSKVVGEEVLSSFHRAYGIEAAALRLAWVWGERERRWWLTEGRAQVDSFADGLWGYVDARDAARAFRLAVEAPLLDALAYNINAADTMADEESAALARRLMPSLGDLPEQLVGRGSFFSSERARDVLGWEPEFSWLDGELMV